MDKTRENSLRNNAYFEVRGVHQGKIICLCKSTGELTTVYPNSTAHVLKVAPMPWWIAKGWAKPTRLNGYTLEWKQAIIDLCAYGYSLGAINLETFNELIRQRAQFRLAKLKALVG